MKNIDLRSDTVTLPTPEMREAMKQAELGDDVFSEDPTVNKLEAMAAEKMGKEAAVLVSSGTQGNLVSILAHCQRGDEAILGSLSHTYRFEAGGISALGGVHVFTVPNDQHGRLDPMDVEQAIRPDNVHFPRTSLICIENTHNLCGGSALSPTDIAAVADVAQLHGLPMHLDGARIFNAAVANKVDVKELVKPFSSLTFCLSKGLSCPVGSVVCGSEEFVSKARRIRKAVGGSMRQAGIIAASGIVALESMIDRLAEDHANARLLAEGLAEIPGITVNLELVQTNMFVIHVDKVGQNGVLDSLKERGIKILDRSNGRFRLVTHFGVDQDDVWYTIEAFREVVK